MAAFGGAPQVLYSLAKPGSPVVQDSPTDQPPKIRTEFPETWMWDTIDEERLKFQYDVNRPLCFWWLVLIL